MKRLFVIVAGLLLLGAPARAELQVDEQNVDGGQLTVFKMTVTPAREPVPALSQRLVLREIDEKPGDAATMYYRAIMASENLAKQLQEKFGDDYENAIGAWNSDDWPIEKLREAVGMIQTSPVMTHMREAARRRDCDWGFDLQSIQGADLYMFLLPEIQESRQISRYLALSARLAVEEGRFDDALDALRINLKFGRDVAAEPLLVCGLVGLAEAGVGNRVLIDLIAAPGSPNMYWALAELPSPLIDLRQAMRFELGSVFRVFPFLRDAESQEHSPEEWARLLADAISQLGPLTNGPVIPNETVRRASVTALGLAMYAPAKKRLLALGLDPERVERMPVGQVLAVDAARELRRISDEFERSWYLPYGMAAKQDKRVASELGTNKLEGGFGRVVAAILLPAINAARAAQDRLQWQIDALRVVEAIRMHAAETGKLPARLEDIDAVPVPVNPATGQAYKYRLDGDTAVLELPFSDGFPGVAWRFEIQLAEK